MAYSKTFLTLTAGMAAAFIAACASSPPPAKPASAPQASAAAVPASAPQAKASETDTANAMEKKFQETVRSYKTVQRDGKTLYCKREKVIGSTIPTMQCYTESQLRNHVEATEEIKKRMRRGGGPCVQTGGCQGG
jgi:hypothetical protein